MRIAAADAGFEERIRQQSGRVQHRFRYHTIELPNGETLPGLQSVEHLQWRLGLFGLEEDLRGKRVLDIGAWDGWFSFECERRGAEVMAVDCVELATFVEAKELLGSKVEYRTLDVGELSAERLGRFDIVLFLGVLYHLRHPLLGLEKVVELTTDRALVESFVIQSEARPVPAVMEFYERGELGGQIDNWCGPSPECLMAMCRSAGFARVELRDITNQRASVVCRRRWDEAGLSEVARAHLHSAINNRSYVARFDAEKDEYLCCYFKSAEQGLGVEDVRVEVDGFGVPAVAMAPNGTDAWQVNCVRPPGLEGGRHEVRIRVREGGRSNAAEFVVGEGAVAPSMGLPDEAPELCSAEFHASGDERLAAGRAGSLICYFRSPAERLGAVDVEIECGADVWRADVLSSHGGGVWQANVLLRRAVEVGGPVRVRLGSGGWSGAMSVNYGSVHVMT